jgi:RNA polymerase sigma-70 factor (ECF subfamily)
MRPQNETDAAFQRAAFVARESYGRLVAYLATRWGDLAAAEDALSAAFVAALERWPTQGVPERPESWLLTVARRKLVDSARHAALRDRPEIVAALGDAALDQGAPPPALPDERIRLMLVCAHPAIDAKIRPALILQAVLGLEAKGMAAAFLVSAEAMTKRLVRAKAKIRAAGLRFEEPTASDMPGRLHALLEAIYAAYFLGREGAVSDGDVHDQLRDEALYLARVVATALPTAAEALGFLALLTFCEARRPAQVNAAGAFVPLLEQDAGTWDVALMREGYLLLERAAAQGEIGPFQLEAAIQAAHCYRARSGTVPWGEITLLYQTLVTRYPTIGSRVGFAVATAHAEGDPSNGLAMLNGIDPEAVRTYQPFWVALWHLHTMRGDNTQARSCLLRALSLTTHPRLQAYLRTRLRLYDHPAAGEEPRNGAL